MLNVFINFRQRIFTWSISIRFLIVFLAAALSQNATSCTLSLTSPVNGSILKSPSVTIIGTGGASSEDGDQGTVTATLNGVTIFNYSGSFTVATSFLQSQGVSVSLKEGVNTVNVSGSVGSCSASDSISIVYEPAQSPVNLGENPYNNTCRPMNIATGNKFFVRNEFLSQGISPLALTLFYNSSASENLWSMYYLQSLNITTGIVQANRHDGQVINFIRRDDGTIVTSSQLSERLLLNGDNYELTLANNTMETYNTSGQLLSIRYPSGLTHSLSYASNTIKITNKNDSLVLDLTGDNVTSATLPDGSIINYTYDTASGVDRLLTTTYADNNTRTYLYENSSFPYYITGILDENNNRISSVVYDDQGRAISSEMGEANSGVERTAIEYHEDGRRTLTNALGKKNIYHFTQFNGEYKMTQVEGLASENCASANQAYTYDTNGFMASKTDWKGNVTTYAHNDRGLETSRTEADGTPEARTILTEWHSILNLRTKITEPERETALSYDTHGRLTSQEVTPR